MELDDDKFDYADFRDPNRPRYAAPDEDLPDYIKAAIAKRQAELAAEAEAKARTTP